MNREDVVQAALTVERWCKAQMDCLNCPFYKQTSKWHGYCVINCPDGRDIQAAYEWNLEEHLRTRGLKDAD